MGLVAVKSVHVRFPETVHRTAKMNAAAMGQTLSEYIAHLIMGDHNATRDVIAATSITPVTSDDEKLTTKTSKTIKEAEKQVKNTIRVHLCLDVQNNNKFVRGRKRAKEDIEDCCLRFYNYRKLDKDGSEYELTIPYDNDADLDKTIYELMGEIESTADMRHCNIECEIHVVDDPNRTW